MTEGTVIRDWEEPSVTGSNAGHRKQIVLITTGCSYVQELNMLVIGASTAAVARVDVAV